MVDAGKSKSYSLWATRFYSVVTNEAFCAHSVENGCEEIHVLPVGDDKGDYVVTQPSFDHACHAIGESFIKDAKKLLADYDARKQKILWFAEELSGSAGKIPDKELVKIFTGYWEAVRQFQPYMMLPHYIERELEPWAREKFPSDFEKIASNEAAFEHMKMQKMLLTHTPKEVAREYGWLAVYGMTEQPYDEKHFAAEKKELKKEALDASFRELERSREEFAEFAAKLGKEDALKCTILHRFVFIRTDRIDLWKKHLLIIYPFILYVGHKIGRKLAVRDISMLSREEIISVLEGSSKVSAKELLVRGERKTVVESITRAGTSFTDDKKFMDYIIAIYKKKVIADSVKGICACKGLVRGKVKIYLNRSDISKDESGYVMVCRHTTPQDVTHMKKAIAIVADEGGVTSHSAIVSRELGIPCIVGSKNATSVFTDGELVEVDATNGIIRKIKR
jgi:phosphohistidine swiveling domain-containing protein